MEQWGFYFDQTRCVNCKACVLACKSWNEEKRGDAELTPELTWIETGRYAEPSDYDVLPGSSGQLNFREFSKYHMKENWRRVYVKEFGTKPPEVDVLNFSVSCNHCEEPVCIKACPMGYICKDSERGIVLIDKSKTCIGCQQCQKVCPWDSPQYYDQEVEKYQEGDPKRPRMTKCDLCIDRIREGLKPACVAACIMRALEAGPMDELKERHPDYTDQIEHFPDGKLESLGLDTKPNFIYKKKTVRV